MSTVFASQVDGWDDDGFDGGWNDDDEFRYIPIHYAIRNNAEIEGYTGTPSHYIDIDENPSMYFEQKKYERYSQKQYEQNIGLVRSCMENGIVLPTKEVVGKIIEKLKTLASQ